MDFDDFLKKSIRFLGAKKKLANIVKLRKRVK